MWERLVLVEQVEVPMVQTLEDLERQIPVVVVVDKMPLGQEATQTAQAVRE
jgi:hypothetical protein